MSLVLQITSAELLECFTITGGGGGVCVCVCVWHPQVVDVCVAMQWSAQSLAQRYTVEARRTCYVTPTSYLDLIQTFQTLYAPLYLSFSPSLCLATCTCYVTPTSFKPSRRCAHSLSPSSCSHSVPVLSFSATPARDAHLLLGPHSNLPDFAFPSAIYLSSAKLIFFSPTLFPNSIMFCLMCVFCSYERTRSSTVDGKRRYETGLEKLGDTAAQVGDMQRELEVLQPQLARASVETAELLAVIEVQSKDAAVTKVQRSLSLSLTFAPSPSPLRLRPLLPALSFLLPSPSSCPLPIPLSLPRPLASLLFSLSSLAFLLSPLCISPLWTLFSFLSSLLVSSFSSA